MMMSFELYLAYVVACTVVVIVPGPVVSLVVANSLTHGSRAGLLNVAGTQLGLAVMVSVLAAGLGWLVAATGFWFDWLRLAGAAYLVWMGVRLVISTGGFDQPQRPQRPRFGFVMQGLLVLLSNPKALLFLGAFLPQFVDPRHAYGFQVFALGATFMLVAMISDATYAVLTGRLRRVLSRRGIRLLSRAGGAMLLGGGAWLALVRTR